ncbi:MAG: hypothetical protein M9962_15490, partial [Oligoflexia bacterium]|nr:hypothetical protein [Oligoflexia bacterium]
TNVGGSPQGTNMKLFVIFSFFLFSTLAFPHGVERGGFIKSEIDNPFISKKLKNKIDQKLNSNCQLKDVRKIEEIKTKINIDEIDQGMKDTYFSIDLIATRYDGEINSIYLHAGEYDISNPSIENTEIIEIKSDLCRYP